MTTQRKMHSTDFKAKVALEALRNQQTTHQLAGRYGVHPNQVAQWKRQALEALPQIFSDRRARSAQADEELKAQLYQQIGQGRIGLVEKKSWAVRLGPSAS